jgi:hypothetical protein
MNMATDAITPSDLQSFREDLLRELLHILEQWQGTPARKWLKTHEVLRLLRVAPSTLQTMRNRGILPYTKIGNVIYYDVTDVQRLLNSKTGPRTTAPGKLNANPSRP